MLIEIAPPSLIAEGSRVKGTLTFHSSTQVFGIVEGDVIQESLEPIQVGKTGWIHGDIHSQGPVLIEGRIEGDIRSATHIRLMPTAMVQGVLSAPSIEIRPGALLDGELRMHNPPSVRSLVPQAA
jgi:cytoskeletal protein CcmA (bactofilin family)